MSCMPAAWCFDHSPASIKGCKSGPEGRPPSNPPSNQPFTNHPPNQPTLKNQRTNQPITNHPNIKKKLGPRLGRLDFHPYDIHPTHPTHPIHPIQWLRKQELDLHGFLSLRARTGFEGAAKDGHLGGRFPPKSAQIADEISNGPMPSNLRMFRV